MRVVAVGQLSGGWVMRRFLLVGLLVMAAGGGAAGALAHAVHGAGNGEPAVSLRASDMAPVPGERVVFRGRVTPSRAGELVRFQQRDRGGWRTVATPRLRDGSDFSLVRRLTSAGAVAF